jgi:hypothetical protein
MAHPLAVLKPEMRASLSFLTLASAALALDFVSTDNFFSFTPTSQFGWTITGASGSGCAGQSAFGPNSAASFTFNFPQPSTSFEWHGYQSEFSGKATVCFDGATGSACDTVSYFNATAAPGATSLYRKTGLSNAVHSVIVTNIIDSSHGNQYGEITMDKVVLDGSAP